MSGYADPQRKGMAGSGAASSATGNLIAGELDSARSVESLVATSRLLNARPAVVALRAMAGTLTRQPREVDSMAVPRTAVAPVQLMNAQPPDEEEWGPFQSADDQQVAEDEWGPFQGAGDQQVAEDEWGPFQGAGDQQIAEDEWGPFQGGGVAAVAAPPVPNLHAGHGLEVGIGAHLAANGPMYTTSLFNCIALLAYDPQTPLACLYHWNTGGGAFEMDDGQEDEDGEMQYGLVPSEPGIAAAKAIVDGGAPGATAYHAVFGRSWGDAELAPRRAAFEAALTHAFPGITIFATPHGSARWVAPNLTGY
ncbi:hypothetical protein NDN01_19775 [Sphingomonas sp. QA11]|uniref:hypothetical protein n=1 Tax=Sphingomonas sp. QA11 TaxID=2950605 RepID=UPI002349CD48|nr:hypothetical protein [Sphingomonas sp. QA11]WCM26223.1 hypothetical protein NDN01_19775 [Sphingomonas sp. QA11]